MDKDLETHISFTDLEKVYDSVLRGKQLWMVLVEDYEIGNSLIRIIQGI